jgi:hypothetical protein
MLPDAAALPIAGRIPVDTDFLGAVQHREDLTP